MMVQSYQAKLNIDHQESNLVEDYAGGACRKANFFAEWIYLPNAYGKGIHFNYPFLSLFPTYPRSTSDP